MFHAFAGSDKSVSPGNDQQYKVVVKTQIIDIESFNTREGLSSALTRATLESTGSELEDLELFESSRGKREKYAFVVAVNRKRLPRRANVSVCKHVFKLAYLEDNMYGISCVCIHKLRFIRLSYNLKKVTFESGIPGPL